MAVRGYILIGTAAGTAGTVYKGLHKLAVTGAKVLSADTVTGPFGPRREADVPQLEEVPP